MQNSQRRSLWLWLLLLIALSLLVVAVVSSNTWLPVVAAIVAAMAGMLWRGGNGPEVNKENRAGNVYLIDAKTYLSWSDAGQVSITFPECGSGLGDVSQDAEIQYLLTVKRAKGGSVRSLLLFRSSTGTYLLEAVVSDDAIRSLEEVQSEEEKKHILRSSTDSPVFKSETN